MIIRLTSAVADMYVVKHAPSINLHDEETSENNNADDTSTPERFTK